MVLYNDNYNKIKEVIGCFGILLVNGCVECCGCCGGCCIDDVVVGVVDCGCVGETLVLDCCNVDKFVVDVDVDNNFAAGFVGLPD